MIQNVVIASTFAASCTAGGFLNGALPMPLNFDGNLNFGDGSVLDFKRGIVENIVEGHLSVVDQLREIARGLGHNTTNILNIKADMLETVLNEIRNSTEPSNGAGLLSGINAIHDGTAIAAAGAVEAATGAIHDVAATATDLALNKLNTTFALANALLPHPVEKFQRFAAVASLGVGQLLGTALLPAQIHDELWASIQQLVQSNMHSLQFLTDGGAALMGIIFGMKPNGLPFQDFCNMITEAIGNCLEEGTVTIRDFIEKLRLALEDCQEVTLPEISSILLQLVEWKAGFPNMEFDCLLQLQELCQLLLHKLPPPPTHAPSTTVATTTTTLPTTVAETTTELPTTDPPSTTTGGGIAGIIHAKKDAWRWAISDAAIFILQKLDLFRPNHLHPENFLKSVSQTVKDSTDETLKSPSLFITELVKTMDTSVGDQTINALAQYLLSSMDETFPKFETILTHISTVVDEKAGYSELT